MSITSPFHCSILAPCVAALVVAATIASGGPSYDFSAVTALANGALAGQNVNTPVPGFDLLLMKDGVVVYHRSFGAWSLDRPANADSATKTLSGALIMSLTDSSVLPFSLDTRLSTYIPAFSGDKANINIRQSFSHTSGLGDSAFVGSNTLTLQQVAQRIAIVPLEFSPPNSAFSYGGASMHAAGTVAEIAGQKPWNTLFAERILAPIGMTHTSFVLTTVANPRIAGGCESNASDFAIFMETLRRGGVAQNGNRVLSQSAVNQMFTRQTASPIMILNTPVQSPFTDGADYGVGVWLDERDASGKLIGALAAGARGFSSWIDFDDGMVGVFATDLSAAGNVQSLLYLLRSEAQSAARFPLCPPDLDHDGIVADSDFELFIVAYNTNDCASAEMRPGCQADLNRDGAVGDADFQLFVGSYNALVCP